VESTYPRTDVQLLARPDEQSERGGARVVTVDPPAPAYTCSRCAADWQYHDVRNTGRCPSCGSGLLRNADWP
jgi:predicted Zn-ribbon and HTH transcriptional regulator